MNITSRLLAALLAATALAPLSPARAGGTPPPAVEFASVFGGSGDDVASAVTVDASGAVYLVGETSSADYPGANAQVPIPCNWFVSILEPGGQSLRLSVVGGGSGDDRATCVALGANGLVYVGGETDSPDFPTTRKALRRKNAGIQCDAFVLVLDPKTGRVVFSTLLGTDDGFDTVHGIAVDAAGNPVVVGETKSKSFPRTAGTVAPPPESADYRAFVAKLNRKGRKLVFSATFGGGREQYARAVALDAAGNIYVAGETSSEDFPRTPNAFQSASVLCDAFVSVFDPRATTLRYSSVVGGPGDDRANAIALGPGGLIAIAGETTSDLLPNLHLSEVGGNGDAMVAVFRDSEEGLAIAYSSIIGGSEADRFAAVGVDAAGGVYAAGETASTDFPQTAGAPVGSPRNGAVVAFDPDERLRYAVLLSGEADDRALGIAVEGDGSAWIAGATASEEFPRTPGAFGTAGILCNGFVVRLAPPPL
jgi:hypothetical protein